VTGAVSQHDRFGCLNGTYGFDGNDFISCGNDSSLNAGTGDISLAAWVRVTGRQPDSWQPTTTGGYFGAIAGKGFLANETGFGIYTRSSLASRDNYCFEFQVRQSGTVSAVRSGSQVSQFGIPDQWRFVVGVVDRDRLDGLRLYVDGQLTNSTDPLTLEGRNLTDSVRFTAGCRDTGSMGFYFNGLIDDVRLYKRALGAQEILTMYQNERP
jgi:hypothetical protein